MHTSAQNDDSRTVTLWQARIPPEYDPAADYRSLLSPDEQARADRFRFERDRRFFVFCRATLRRLLGRRLDREPDSLQFTYGPRGKPALADGPIVFNASHAAELFVCAISIGAPLGVDVEHIHPLDDMQAMARHFFAPRETELLLSLPTEQRTDAFFECWTRKEAVIKATGEGVSRALDSFEVAFGPDSEPALLRLDDDHRPGWQMLSFTPQPDYIVALASPGAWATVQCRSENFSL